MVECVAWLIMMLVFATEVDTERQVWELPEQVLLAFFELARQWQKRKELARQWLKG